MIGVAHNSPTPRVSIVLPTFNRAEMLDAAVRSIAQQSFTDWELIVVDDGSTDPTEAVVRELAAASARPIRYFRRSNGGPGAARQTGVEHARGDLLAFFDSDDLWLPHHLTDSVAALDANPDVDWVFSSVSIEDARTGDVLNPDVFQPRTDRAVLNLQVEHRGELHVLRDPLWLDALLAGDTLSGFQVSVIRRRVFEQVQIASLRVAEDLALTAEAMYRGFTLAYLDRVHVRYRVHDGNISAASPAGDWRRRLTSQRRYNHGLRWLRRRLHLRPAQRRLVSRAIARHCFWRIAYNVLWSAGQRHLAVRRMRLALAVWPWDWRMWKTAGVCAARLAWARLACRSARYRPLLRPASGSVLAAPEAGRH